MELRTIRVNANLGSWLTEVTIYFFDSFEEESGVSGLASAFAARPRDFTAGHLSAK